MRRSLRRGFRSCIASPLRGAGVWGRRLDSETRASYNAPPLEDPLHPRTHRAAGRLALCCLSLCTGLLGLGCRTGYYDAYRAAHPEWDGSFPRENAPLEEVLAALHAPASAEGTRIELTALELWRVDGDVSSRVDFEALRRGEADLHPDTDVAVLALRTCRAERGLQNVEALRIGWYLLPDQHLSAYDHYAFGKVCAVSNEFRAARGAAIPLETAASARIAADYGRVPVDLSQLYRRGLAYLEAGRVADAEAALTRGEIGFRALEQRVVQGGLPPEALAEPARLRAQLMRALGVETRTGPAPAPR